MIPLLLSLPPPSSSKHMTGNSFGSIFLKPLFEKLQTVEVPLYLVMRYWVILGHSHWASLMSGDLKPGFPGSSPTFHHHTTLAVNVNLICSMHPSCGKKWAHECWTSWAVARAECLAFANREFTCVQWWLSPLCVGTLFPTIVMTGEEDQCWNNAIQASWAWVGETQLYLMVHVFHSLAQLLLHATPVSAKW